MIAIIAILAAILFPVFARARENARRSSCQSNLKQIALGIKQYVQDYDERFPLAVLGPGPDNGSGWADTTQPYLKSTQIYQCPSESNPPNSAIGTNGYCDYWYNGGLSWNGNTTSGGTRWNSRVSEAALLFSSLTVMVGDGSGESASPQTGTARMRSNGNGMNISNDVDKPDGFGAVNATVDNLGFAHGGQRHLEGLNMAFADGHVKWYKASGEDQSGKVYTLNSSFDVSGQNPTFNVSRQN